MKRISLCRPNNEYPYVSAEQIDNNIPNRKIKLNSYEIEPFRFLEELNFGREEYWGDVTIVLPFTNAMVLK